MKRILACDDSSFIQKMVKRELESSFEVEIFSDGFEAYEHLKNDPNFDFAIIDGEMPNLNGWELIKKIKTELNLVDLPVVMLTASDDDYFKNKAYDIGAFDYLKKPFKQGELYEYVQMFFKTEGFSHGVVLVVEDSKLQNKTICHQLKEKGILPISAYSGEEAVKILLEGKQIDAILLDINLPGASGFDVAKGLKNDERFKSIPIIGLTAAVGKEAIETMKKAFESGVDDFLTKPYNMVEFYARLNVNIERGKLTRRLKEESERDYLTKLYNRRYAFTFLQQLINLSKRNNQPLSFVILDIDKFKKINDTYGHNVGDEALKHIANLIQSTIRKSDIAGRWGGEEFCIILPETQLNEACMVAEKVRKAITTTPLEIGATTITINISAGVSTLKENEDANSLIKRADDALYEAKEKGRNRSFKFDEAASPCK
ncbi:diguanylate cyclase [Hippea jasoniae]|uniref:diguanylate cyclase n=1 Tax=Hippea jasoniae TaxID=944479 RepID=UPI00054FC466|nr:diguanylate cyclase [Hippea jasoniae]